MGGVAGEAGCLWLCRVQVSFRGDVGCDVDDHKDANELCRRGEERIIRHANVSESAGGCYGSDCDCLVLYLWRGLRGVDLLVHAAALHSLTLYESYDVMLV